MRNVLSLFKRDPYSDPAEVVAARLVRAFGWTPAIADYAVKDIRAISPSLREPFRAFWNTKVFDASLKVGDFTVGQLVAAGIDPMSAFLMLDRVHKEPRLGSHKVRIRLHQLKHPLPPNYCHVTYKDPDPPEIKGW